MGVVGVGGGLGKTGKMHSLCIVLPDGKIMKKGGTESAGAVSPCRHGGVQAHKPVLCVRVCC